MVNLKKMLLCAMTFLFIIINSVLGTCACETSVDKDVMDVCGTTTKLTLQLGSEYKLYNSRMDVIKCTVKNKNILVVNDKGIVTAKKPGTTTVTLKIREVQWGCVLVYKQVYKITVKNKYTLKPGEKFTIKLKNAKYSTSNKKIATVSKKGVVKAKKSGSVTITAKVRGKSYKYKVRVQKWVVDKPAWVEIIEHPEVGEWQTIEHEAQYKREYIPTYTEEILIKEAWTETIPGYETTIKIKDAVYSSSVKCHYCNAHFVSAHLLLSHQDYYNDLLDQLYELYPYDTRTEQQEALIDRTLHHSVSGWATGDFPILVSPAEYATVWVPEQTIEHPAEYERKTIWAHYETILEKEAWTETVWIVLEEAWTEYIRHDEIGHWE